MKTLVLIFLASAAVKHIADILLHGSIFQGLRSFIARGERRGVFMFGTLHQLFTCLLCMTTQVSFWLAGIPAWIMAYQETGSVGWGVLAAFLATMAIAALAQGWWTALEYAPRRYHAVKRELKESELENDSLKSRLAQNIRENTGSSSAELLRMALPKETFVRGLEDIARDCANIGCSVRRYYCYMDGIKKFLSAHPEVSAASHQIKWAFSHSAESYLNDVHEYRMNAEERVELQNRLYEELVTKVA